MAVRTVAQLAEQVKNDPQLAEQMKEDPAAALAQHAYTSDPKFYRIAIIGLILIILIVVISGVVLAAWNVPAGKAAKSLPDGILAIGTTALGVLGGLFAPSPSAE